MIYLLYFFIAYALIGVLTTVITIFTIKYIISTGNAYQNSFYRLVGDDESQYACIPFVWPFFICAVLKDCGLDIVFYFIEFAGYILTWPIKQVMKLADYVFPPKKDKNDNP